MGTNGPDHEFCDECPLCRPAIIDISTGREMSPDHKLMKAVNRIWDQHTTYEQRRAFIRVTRFNSREAADVLLFEEVVTKIKQVSDLLGDDPPTQFRVVWLDAGREPQDKPNPAYPHGVEIGCLAPGPHCRCMLPYPAPRCGSHIVTCNRCGVTVACTAAGRPDDPRSIMVPCKKVVVPENN